MEKQGLVQLKEPNTRRKNKMANTEKPMTIAEKKQTQIKDVKKTEPASPRDDPKGPKPVAIPKLKEKPDDKKDSTPKGVPSVKGDVNTEGKKPIQKKPIVKKTEAVVNAKSLPISTKYAIAICRFIKKKKIEKAIAELEQVLMKKKAVPMKGEIPHRKGKMMSGRYPKKATEHFITILKSLQANAIATELEEPVIAEAMANLAQRPYGRGGRRKKRTHVKIIAREKKKVNKEEEKK